MKIGIKELTQLKSCQVMPIGDFLAYSERVTARLIETIYFFGSCHRPKTLPSGSAKNAENESSGR